MILRLEQLLPNLLHVGRDHNEVAGGKTDQDVTVPKPLVGDNTAVPGLKSKLDRVFRIIEVE